MDRPVDPATNGDNAVILYDGRTGYSYQGITGNDLHHAIHTPLPQTPGLSLMYVESSMPGFVAPVWQWDGWRLKLVNEAGLQIVLDNTLHEAMYFVWEPVRPDVTPDRTSNDVRHMLTHLTRSAAPGHYGNRDAPIQRSVGYKDAVFAAIGPYVWKPLPGRGGNPSV
jgi:hypothetical protein